MRPRLLHPELLDTAPAAEAAHSLRDLERINRYLGGHAVLRRRLREVLPVHTAVRLLDVGAGGGNAGRAIRRAFSDATVVSLDYRAGHLRFAEEPRVVADAFHLPFPPRSFDVVLCSLFLHHFDDESVVRLLRTFGVLARRAVCVVDLERHSLARRFVPATRWLLRWHSLTLHDAPASVQSAFRPDELEIAAARAGFSDYSVASHPPWFRLSLLARV